MIIHRHGLLWKKYLTGDQNNFLIVAKYSKQNRS